MQPMSPVLPSQVGVAPEIVFGEGQPEHRPLPAIRLDDGEVITRWSLTWRERLRLLWSGSIYLSIHTFNHPLSPVRLSTKEPTIRVEPLT